MFSRLQALVTFSFFALLLSSFTEAAPSNMELSLESRATKAEKKAYLKAHNDLRSKHGATALKWDDNLAKQAKACASNCKLEHCSAGENIAAGTGDFGIPAGMKGWANEASKYDPNHPLTSGALHFTQMVWKNTHKLGCAKQTGCHGIFPPEFGPATVYVCEYSPVGNVEGQFKQNVQP